MGKSDKASTESRESYERTNLEKIKWAAIEVISQNGFSNTSVADIASKAELSVGYLYRHYQGKQELVNDIIIDMYQEVLQSTKSILDKCDTVEEVCAEIIKYHFNIYKKFPEKMKFLSMLINDFGENTYDGQKKYITEICQLFYDDFIKKKGVRKGITIEELYVALLVVPMQSLTLRLRGIILSDSKEQDIIDAIKSISLKIVK